ncbi:Cyclic di-GMP phosphodiesterase Gmr [Tritonibacter multivorans]|uniref:Cyclic di-GMP phosphodiesterase Gmr n=2 Tax=Tritonibacter multivorans TaxID=928856 RepID=A0A0N7LZG2_9RHOB|nr:EAL domain-containing protein [Tritonibacter multivorans]MDA7421174.1 EAL domain-containing protein [Tritonibacter multivorans]CUH77577.1 Cyclic di-GMP phosphodiesterase Gmr [Tritonibacter multivorans]SFD33914.1 diguanylate cyclase (GGDEF) domain-containing protein [Tritonibacter multivorans]
MPIRTFRGSLLWRLIVPCMLGLIAVAAANTGSWLARFQTEIESSFYLRGEETTVVIADAVAKAVWTFDSEQAREIMTGFAHIEGFTFGLILADDMPFAETPALATDADLSRIANTFAASGESPVLELGGSVLFKQTIVYNDTNQIGVLVTGFSIAPTQALLQTTRRETVLLQVISFSLLGLMIAFVLRSVIRPLHDITQVIDDVTGGDLDRDVPFLSREDEVGRLATAVAFLKKNARTLISVEAEAEASRRIAKQAVLDELTGLPNRRALMNLFEELDRENRLDTPRRVALLHMDLDGFKQINDTLGHKAGDHVLWVVATRLRAVGGACRGIARIGGDEFVAVLVADTDVAASAKQLADALIPALRAPSEFEGQTVRVGCSIGIAYHDRNNRDLLETLVQADIALYKAKGNGKNQWIEFDEAQRRAVIERKDLTDQIQQGLERAEFVPFFQPIVDAQTGKIRGIEVLSRWQHPVRGLVGPDHFLALAKELKLMRFIDRTILTQAIEVILEVADLPELPHLAVNVSVERLMETDLMEVVKSMQDSPVRLVVELLESAYLDDLGERVIWRIDELRELGVGIHIDDFGTGHSSLAGLLRVSPDVMKIDRRFVAAAPHSRKERALIESMLGIAKTFGIETVCEGVETDEQAELVRSLGCTMLQGFRYFRPMDAESLKSVLRRGEVADVHGTARQSSAG